MKKLFLIIQLLTVMAFHVRAADPAPTACVPGAGMLYFASYTLADNQEVIQNPYIIGALFTFHWADIEHKKGLYDWEVLDRRIENWVKAGKKVALRIMWSSSGYWQNPVSAHPTPQWVWKAGAKFAFHPESKTEIPLVWDPVFRRHAMDFQREVNRKYGSDPNILFIDVTPGAETNPYRFGTIDRLHPEFREVFERTQASDGRTYSNELWVETVCGWIAETASIFTQLPCLVTLNVGSLQKENNFPVIGQCAVDNGMYVGQNGLRSDSYIDDEQQRKILFRQWAGKTKLFFEMVHAAETSNTGSLAGVVGAAERIGCDYLNVYAVDVIKSSRNIPSRYDPQWEEAMKTGYEYFRAK